MDDTPITLPTYWAQVEPNNAGGNENCLQFKLYGDNFHWNDVSCNEIAGFICQFNSLILESTPPDLHVPEQTTLFEEPIVNFHETSSITESLSSVINDQSTTSTTRDQSTTSTIGDQSTTSTTGDQTTTSTTRDQSTTSTIGDQSTTSTTGDQSTTSTTRDQSTTSTIGDQSTTSTTRDKSTTSTIGDQSTTSTTGHQATISTTDDQSTTSTTGSQSTTFKTGHQATISTTDGQSITSTTGTATPFFEDKNRQEQHTNYVTNKNNIKETFETGLSENLTETEKLMRIENVLSRLQDISFTNQLTSEDLDNFLDSLDKILDDCKKFNITLPKTVIVTTIDNLLAENHTAAWKNISTEQLRRRVSKIFRIVDKFGLLVLETINENESITFNTTKNIVFNAAKLLENDTIMFPTNNHTLGSSLVLPAQAYGSPQSLPYLAVNYKTLGSLINNIKGHEEKLGYRIPSDIMSLTINKTLVNRSLDPPLHMKFLKKKDCNSINECVFWDFHLNAGGWSTVGCKLQSENHPYVNCGCNHLTNFAVLVRSYSRTQDEEEVLSWISIIGCAISVFLSLLTAIIYIVFWKTITCDVSRMVNKITVLLCLSIALAYTIFLIGVDKIQYKVGCVVITALLQYMFLLIFVLMLALGLYYFSSISLVKISFSKATTFQSKVNFFNKIVWGIVVVIPISITAITIGVVYSLNKDYHSKSSCWLSFDSGALYGFIGPVAGIVLINIVIVIILAVTLCSTGYSPQDKTKNRILAGIKSICTLLPVLGVTWLFGLLSINEDVVVFQYIFALLNSFQGLFIFISKCLLSKKIRKLLSESIHRNDSESWRGRLYSLLSSHPSTMNTKEFSSFSKSHLEKDSKIKDGKRKLIKGISFRGRYSDNTAL
ncbi:adhesion G protein-coupled receptor L4-like isoform X2 [Saccostrea cucullata]|uniref:adhesion G protein-coupled receptor L4-like isoform X2 n=1 Tax=Saccostrea cuccullata TaxID=36930 RepID=UPI002ED4CC21